MTDLRLCVDLVDFELMHVTVVMQVLDKRTEDSDAIYDSQNQPNERQQTDFSNFWDVDGGIRMTLIEANAFIKALSLSSGIEITTPYRERKGNEKPKAQAPLQNNEPQQVSSAAQGQAESTASTLAANAPAAVVSPAPAAAPVTPAASATPAFSAVTSAAPHFNQAAAPREETAKGIAERFSAGTAK